MELLARKHTHDNAYGRNAANRIEQYTRRHSHFEGAVKRRDGYLLTTCCRQIGQLIASSFVALRGPREDFARRTSCPCDLP